MTLSEHFRKHFRLDPKHCTSHVVEVEEAKAAGVGCEQHSAIHRAEGVHQVACTCCVGERWEGELVGEGRFVITIKSIDQSERWRGRENCERAFIS